MGERVPLTPRQARILDVIRDTVRDRGYPPTLRELTAAVGISSSSTASEQLRLLEARGYIRVTPNTPRGIMVLDPAGAVAADALDAAADALEGALGQDWAPKTLWEFRQWLRERATSLRDA
jgi:SOS-response transcriptional repressor LexA